jgi:hypothetical protein
VTVRFLEIAEVELDQAIRWYSTQAPGLGDAFLLEVYLLPDASRTFQADGSYSIRTSDVAGLTGFHTG